MATFADDDAALWMDVTQQMKVKGLTSVSAFRVMDRDRGGTVSGAELFGWARTAGIAMTSDDARRLVRSMNGGRGGGGGFTFKTFSQVVRHYQQLAKRKTRGKTTRQSTSAVRRSVQGEFGGVQGSNMSAVGKSVFLKTMTAKYTLPSHGELSALWASQDVNANGLLSLAEIDRVVQQRFPAYDHKPALMRAYKFADADGSGLISKREFCLLLRSLFFFNDLCGGVPGGARGVQEASGRVAHHLHRKIGWNPPSRRVERRPRRLRVAHRRLGLARGARTSSTARRSSTPRARGTSSTARRSSTPRCSRATGTACCAPHTRWPTAGAARSSCATSTTTTITSTRRMWTRRRRPRTRRRSSRTGRC